MMTAANRLISVVIPAYNAEHYIAEAIESILRQDYDPLEILVVDDGSTDATKSVVNHYSSVMYYFQEHAGIGSALNRGIRETKGEFLSFLDADDIWTQGKLTKQMGVFDTHHDVECVFGHIESFLSPELSAGQEAAIGVHTGVQPGYSKCTMLIKRDSLLCVGMFDPAWTIGEFIDWYARALDKGIKSHLLSDILAKRRIHGANISIREREKQIEFVQILRRALDRRRNV
jgi:glycosyltransferase involved in cell wall biosynthesis